MEVEDALNCLGHTLLKVLSATVVRHFVQVGIQDVLQFNEGMRPGTTADVICIIKFA